MNPIAFGALCALAVILPIYGFRESIAVWLLDVLRKLDELDERVEQTEDQEQ